VIENPLAGRKADRRSNDFHEMKIWDQLCGLEGRLRAIPCPMKRAKFCWQPM
jgi:hypothetical protein